MSAVAGLWKQYAGGPRRPTHRSTPSTASQTGATTTSAHKAPESDPFFDHTWEPSPGHRGKDTYADLEAAREEAEERKREREKRIALERREAEIERREREIKRKQEVSTESDLRDFSGVSNPNRIDLPSSPKPAASRRSSLPPPPRPPRPPPTHSPRPTQAILPFHYILNVPSIFSVGWAGGPLAIIEVWR